MVNILYLSHTGSNIGGGENRLLGLIKNLDRGSYNPIVVCPDTAGEFYSKLESFDIPVYVCRLPGWRKFRSYPFRHLAAVRLAGLARKNQIDLVHTSDLWLNYYAWQVGRTLNIPLVSHVRNLLEPENIHKYLFEKCDKIIAIAERIKKPLVDGGISLQRIEVIYNGIDLSKFTLKDIKTNVLRQDYNLRKYLIGLIGRIEPFKRQKEFIQVISEVVKARQDVSFLIIGSPAKNQQDYFNEVQQAIEEYNVSKYVVFTGYRRDMPEVLNSLDLVVSLSAGGIIMEAMASGLPVVGTDIASTSEMIDDGITGLLLPQDDIYGVSEAILRLLKDEEMRNKMGKAGRSRVKELFDVRKNTKMVENVYENLLT